MESPYEYEERERKEEVYDAEKERTLQHMPRIWSEDAERPWELPTKESEETDGLS